MPNKLSTRGLLSNMATHAIYNTALKFAYRNGWNVTDQCYPFFMAEKDNYVAIPGKVILIWDAQTCIISTLLYHEPSSKYTLLFRKVLYCKAINRIIGYPRQHLHTGHCIKVAKVYFSHMPDINTVIHHWHIILKKNKINSI